jgi:hypothetical protein
MLEDLLNHIVAKYISHQLQGIWLDFTEDLVLLIAIGRLKFLLNEPGTMLITTEFNYMTVDVLI